MFAVRTSLMALLLLAACDGNPFSPVPGGGGGGTPGLAVPAEVSRDLRSITYSPNKGGQLSVDLNGLVASGGSATFVRDASLDVGNYQAFKYQETGLQRSYLAYVAKNKRGDLLVTAVSDGGQFNAHYGGATFARISVYQAPTVRDGVETGQFSYAGDYAGVLTVGDATSATLAPGLTPNGAYHVEGDTLINANFANSLVNGGVDNRFVLDNAGNRVDVNADGNVDSNDMLPAIALLPSAINSSGAFTGDVQIFGPPDTPGSKIGTYAGLFGGIGATDVAGVLVFNPLTGASPEEFGVFNLPRCDTAGASPLCVPR